MRTAVLGILLLLCFEANSKNYFANYMIVGSSFTYITNSVVDEYKTVYGFDEYTWNLNVGVRINKRIFTGVQILNIYSSEIATKKNYYSVAGLFTQYNLLNKETHRLFAELSINKGNYFTGDDIPYAVNNLYYIGLGGGYDLPIKWLKNIYLDLSFINYLILNNMKNKENYTQYIIGLNYRFNTK